LGRRQGSPDLWCSRVSVSVLVLPSLG
jgi:hypothetical protein